MGLNSQKVKKLKKEQEPLVKFPKATFETIDISRVAVNGIFEHSKNRYSTCYKVSDINYQTSTDDDRMLIFENYCKCLNSLDVDYKITILNKQKSIKEMKENVFYTKKEDDFNDWRDAINSNIEEKIFNGRQGVEQEKYLTISITKDSYEDAKKYFVTVEKNIKLAFSNLDANITQLDSNKRLMLLRSLYRMGEDNLKNIDINDYLKTGSDFRTDICNTKETKYKSKQFTIDDRFAVALKVTDYPKSLDDEFLSEITNMPIFSLTSIDIVPIDKELTNNLLTEKYLGVENDIRKQQQKRNKNNDFSSDISLKKQTEKKEIFQMIENVKEDDQKMFYVSVTIVVFAETQEELNGAIQSIKRVGSGAGVKIEEHWLKQREAFNTALPLGVRQVNTMRLMLTPEAAALMPFTVQELCEPGENIYYGINQLSKNIIMGNRKLLTNGNGWIFGVPGAGKSFFAKTEMSSAFLRTEDDIIIIDPTHEYFDLAEKYDGETIVLSSSSDTYVNPLDFPLELLDTEEGNKLINEKVEFMLGLCEQAMGETVNSRHKSLIGRCVRFVYDKKAALPLEERICPIMEDFYNELMEQEEEEGKYLGLSLELFVTGTLNLFNHQTNINIKNRFTVFGIKDLGEQLMPLASLVMLETITKRIANNAKKGRATWLYIDEIHVLLDKEFTAEYLEKTWKLIRKMAGMCTGITQNIYDVLHTKSSTTMLSNSEFLILLKQSALDASSVCKVVKGIKENHIKFVESAMSGTGIIKHGEKVIPFDSTISKDSELYKLFNTNLHEKIANKDEKLSSYV